MSHGEAVLLSLECAHCLTVLEEQMARFLEHQFNKPFTLFGQEEEE